MKKWLFIALLSGAFAQAQFVDRFTKFEESCTTIPGELNTTTSIDSDLYCVESNSLAGWIVNGNVTISLESVDTDAGLYALKVVSDDGGTGFAYKALGANGDDLDVKVRLKQTVGSNARYFCSPASDVLSYFLTSSWFEHSGSTSGTGTVFHRVYPAGSSGAGNAGDTVLLAYISVAKTN